MAESVAQSQSGLARKPSASDKAPTASIPGAEVGEPPPKPQESETPLQVFRAGSPSSKQIALTFDDGPHGTITPRILDMLRERQVKATFFVLGDRVKHYEWVLRQIVAEGHEIGNHAYSHRILKFMSNDLIDREIAETQSAIRNAIGYETRLFRPPYGDFRPDTRAVFRKYNLEVILWSVDTLDWKLRNRDKIFNVAINDTHNGSIILCHDIHRATLEAVPDILGSLIAKGYEFVTISQLCGLPPMRLASVSAPPPPPPQTP
ncbi:MAG: polysaccharide deacetylase family protein [Verrucomicrobia bacterium]|nr:polysaccharide deacetylase family protein [Verrucomicrobiota bacterium]